MDVISLVEHILGSEASGSTTVGLEPSDPAPPIATRRDVIPGIPSEVARARATAHATVLETRTSARSRPSAHRTDEPEEVDGGVVREAPAPLERADDRLDGGKVRHLSAESQIRDRREGPLLSDGREWLTRPHHVEAVVHLDPFDHGHRLVLT